MILSGLIAVVAGGAAFNSDCGLPADEPAFVLNQIGFETEGRKIAILRSASDGPVPWRVVGEDGTTHALGLSQVFGADEVSGDSVHWIDFSAVAATGSSVRIEACGTASRSFSIGPVDHSAMADEALSYFYQNRMGVPLDADFLPGDQWSRPAGFVDMRLTCFTGADKWGTQWPGCDYSLDVTGGWADAGDYGQYAVNGGISVWTLQHAHERLVRSDGLEATGWADGRARLPEAGNGASDILDEARVHLELLMAMQIPADEQVWISLVDAGHPEGEPLPLEQIDAGGLVHHKMHERAWLTLPLMPGDAHEPRFLYPPSTAATLNLAATAAQCARLWRETDPNFAARCLNAAERAYDAALAHPDLFAVDNFDGGGAYGDFRVEDEFAWAATELFLTTGDARYREAVEAWVAGMAGGEAADVFWASADLLPALSLVLHDGTLPGEMIQPAQAAIIARAERYIAERDASAYRLPAVSRVFTWGSNGNLSNRAIVLGMASELTGDRRFRDAVLDVFDYLLGRNPLDQSYVAGFGERAMQYAHHRFWAAGADPEYPPAPPGALSGGANWLAMADPVAQEMDGSCAPLRCWADHVDAYALNEVAINWNAPFFWMLVYLETTQAAAGD